jgi:hypothetical protein
MRWLVVVVVLAGCAPGPSADTVRGRCELQADKDPAVQTIIFQQLSIRGSPKLAEDLTVARRKAVNSCLTAAGVALPGGVEPVSRARYGFGSY